ncbi:YceI family protein, partial [Vibrio parahaemolyticus]
QTINDEILRGAPITFRSTVVTPQADAFTVNGELELVGRTRPAAFTLSSAGDRITGSATVTQSNWGIKPYTALFGTLKVL